MLITTAWILLTQPSQYKLLEAARLCLALFILITQLNKVFTVCRYRWMRARDCKGMPSYPSLLPYFGHVFQFIGNPAELIRDATSYKGRLTSTAITIMGHKLYLFQDRETVAEFIKQPDLSSPIPLYVFALKNFLGMSKKSLAVYVDDESGPHRKSYPETNTKFRIDYTLHRNFVRAWSGPRLLQTTFRFREALQSNLAGLNITESSWVETPDFFQYLSKPVSASITEAIFGPMLLKLNPGFLDNLWAYDALLPWMARGIPSFLIPTARRLRNRLTAQTKKWQSYARVNFQEAHIKEDGSDPFWGSGVVRHLCEVLSSAGTHDPDAMSAHHLGMIFAANFKLVPAVAVTMLHIISEPGLLQRVQDEVEAHFTRIPSEDGSMHRVELPFETMFQMPLLSSICAETLRLHVKVFLARSSRSDIRIGKWLLPRGTLGLVNTDGLHTNERIWNTQDGRHPVDTFWAERFLVDRSDPSSGPVKLEFRPHSGEKDRRAANARSKYMSVNCLEGSMLPFGGGTARCPGQALARNAVMLACTILICRFDFEVTGKVNMNELDNWRYGLGVMRPKNPIPVKIRARRGRVQV